MKVADVARETLMKMSRDKVPLDIHLSHNEDGEIAALPVVVPGVVALWPEYRKVPGVKFEVRNTTLDFRSIDGNKVVARMLVLDLGFHGTFLKVGGVRFVGRSAHSIRALLVPAGVDPGEIPP